MKNKLLLLLLFLMIWGFAFSQVAINESGEDPDPSAILDLKSTDKGFLVPRMTTAEREAISTTQSGLLVYDTDKESFWHYNSQNTSWVEIGAGGSAGANSINDLSDGIYSGLSIYMGEDAGINDDGTDNLNTGVGYSALQNTTTGYRNTAFGMSSLREATVSYGNTSIGYAAMLYNEGSETVAIGHMAGRGNPGTSTDGSVYLGYNAGFYNTDNNKLFIDNSDTYFPLIGGDFETNQVNIHGSIKITGGNPAAGKVLTSDAEGNATWQEAAGGASSLDDLSDAINDNMSVFIGSGAGINDDGYNSNTSVGVYSLHTNTSGIYNTSSGYQSMYSNITGSWNSAFGYISMEDNASGNRNTAIGFGSLRNNTVGNDNIVLGYNTLMYSVSGDRNVAIGNESGYYSTGFGNIFLGNQAGYFETGNNKLYIDNSNTETPLIGGDFQANQVKINGDLVVSQNVTTSGEYKYVQTKTKLLSIPPAAFSSSNPHDEDEGLFSIGSGRWYVETNVDDGLYKIHAPVYLPDGAELTRFSWYYNKSNVDLSVKLYRILKLSNVSTTMAGFADYTDNPYIVKIDDTTINDNTIDNTQYYYFIVVILDKGSTGWDYSSFYGAEIEYTIDYND